MIAIFHDFLQFEGWVVRVVAKSRHDTDPIGRPPARNFIASPKARGTGMRLRTATCPVFVSISHCHICFPRAVAAVLP